MQMAYYFKLAIIPSMIEINQEKELDLVKPVVTLCVEKGGKKTVSYVPEMDTSSFFGGKEAFEMSCLNPEKNMPVVCYISDEFLTIIPNPNVLENIEVETLGMGFEVDDYNRVKEVQSKTQLYPHLYMESVGLRDKDLPPFGYRISGCLKSSKDPYQATLVIGDAAKNQL
jgi:hypothetical protein